MPTFVRTDKCHGCKGWEKTACMYIRPEQMRQEMEKQIDSPDE